MLKPRGTRRTGFTLIELLIVIAIILILIAIALPNFLEAQIRARITKAKAELRSLNIAMQEYYLDWKVYPPENAEVVLLSINNINELAERGLMAVRCELDYSAFMVANQTSLESKNLKPVIDSIGENIPGSSEQRRKLSENKDYKSSFD